MDVQGIAFRYPFFVSAMGPAFTSVVTHCMKWSNRLELPHSHKVDQRFWLRSILPVGACHAATLASGNAQYMFMGLALIQFLKAFTPIIVTMFSTLLLKRNPSMKIWAVLFVACIGTSMTAAGDMSLRAVGMVLAITSSCTEAIRLVLTEFTLKDCKFGVLEGQYYLAPCGALCLFLLSAVTEVPTMLRQGDLGKIFENPCTFFLAATLGFGVQMVTTSVVKLTSSVTSKVLSQFRNAVVVLFGVAIYGEVVSSIQLQGYLVSFLAILQYSMLVSTEANQSSLPVNKLSS
eukprot:CAMPEP_0184523468 /NCGR_PEP_ID=MMETSP0198_2-20121128/8903_1 /TAXON_ID=1112570 /ORGANISM="Thraustochytrium sp., Strain LLF1b" /LENGTH=289 /DNA_ID=CAMNT_0026914507 /DNA_START=223 /DNA_END=1092 /DNA_ORIENTATION=-